jgi:DNA-binding HxlR family transcriptional regulator
VIERHLCPRFHRAVELIGRRWNGAIVFVLLQDRARFCELRASIPGITDRMLAERLQALERDGVVARTVVPETPVRVEYELTRKGRALAEAFKTISAWAEKWVHDAAPRRPADVSRPRAQRASRL